ncbi:hypothetical protein ACU8DI_15310 [Psychroserpens sp. BH13MA-6]
MNDIFNLGKNYEIKTSLSKTDLEDHLNDLKNFEFYENEMYINGSFVHDLGWDDFANPKLISVRFELENNNLKNLKIGPTFLLNFFLIGLLLGFLITSLEAFNNQVELTDKIGYGITAFGFLASFLIIRIFTKRKIKSTKRKLELE